ncbi:MAG TPA: spermidine/putrescine ABC transporter substrate-binding protein [Tepidisphaeraceae bacterium]|jgi:spermidine/putrescine transport system substrate-binding protein|nr:spermidine/putrescine ABC transporter substrate-binding protein [Tepidisphaeraceae bacterium]
MKNLRLPLIALLAMLLLDGCHKSAVQKLHLFAWSQYVPKEVIDGFTKETGIPVDYEVYDSNEAMVAKLAPGSAQYDVIQPSEYTVEQLMKRNALAPLDSDKLSNLSNLLPEYRHLAYDPGNKYSVPYMSGTVGIVVNTDKIKQPIRGYKDVFQAKYSRRIIALDDNREIVSWAFATAGIPINDVTPENLARVKPMIKQWIPMIKIFDSNDPKDPLLRGEVDIGIVYCGDAAKLIEQDKKFVYILPVEGAHRFIDNLCIPAGSKNKAAAEKFINYTLRPEVSKIISDKFPYTNPNAAARKLLSQSQLSNPASYPPNGEKLELFHDIGKASADISAMMTELRG